MLKLANRGAPLYLSICIYLSGNPCESLVRNFGNCVEFLFFRRVNMLEIRLFGTDIHRYTVVNLFRNLSNGKRAMNVSAKIADFFKTFCRGI